MFDKSKVMNAMKDRLGGVSDGKDGGDGLDGMDMMDETKKGSRVEIDEPDLPEIASWEVGKEYPVKMVIRMTGNDDTDGDGKPNAQFEVVSIESESPEEEKAEGGVETGEPTEPTAPVFKRQY